ncbi:MULTISPECIES: hypothetical protein [unclassified Dolichospermum]|nr:MULTISPECIES: hypothetical protein [unclassified Dolichospermum]
MSKISSSANFTVYLQMPYRNWDNEYQSYSKQMFYDSPNNSHV